MMKRGCKEVRKYIPSKQIRIQNKLLYTAYGVILILSISIYGYIRYSDVQLKRMESELENLSASYVVQVVDSKNKMKETEENIDKQAATIRNEIKNDYYNKLAQEEQEKQRLEQEKKLQEQLAQEEYNILHGTTLIRCTGYCDSGLTASGVWTRSGIAAGKKEWLGKKIAIFLVNTDGSIGEKIGEYEFLDTGAGIDTDGDGVGDTIRNGKSIDIWHESKEACYDWAREYGDYVYMKFIN